MGKKDEATVKFPMCGWRPWGTADTFITTQRHDYRWPVPRVQMCGRQLKYPKKPARTCIDGHGVCRLRHVAVPQYYPLPGAEAAFYAPPGMICIQVPPCPPPTALPGAGMPSKRECECWTDPCGPTEAKTKGVGVPTGCTEYQAALGGTGRRIWRLLHTGALRPAHWDDKPAQPPRCAVVPPRKPCDACCELHPAEYECYPKQCASCAFNAPCQTLTTWRVFPYSVFPECGGCDCS